MLLVVAAITFKFYRKFYCKFYCTCDQSISDCCWLFNDTWNGPWYVMWLVLHVVAVRCHSILIKLRYILLQCKWFTCAYNLRALSELWSALKRRPSTAECCQCICCWCEVLQHETRIVVKSHSLGHQSPRICNSAQVFSQFIYLYYIFIMKNHTKSIVVVTSYSPVTLTCTAAAKVIFNKWQISKCWDHFITDLRYWAWG